MGRSKSFLLIVLAVTIALNTLIIPLIYLDFELRKDYIASVLCIRKDEPITVCGGKCYLARQLNKATNNKSTAATTHAFRFDIIPGNEKLTLTPVINPFITTQQTAVYLHINYSVALDAIDHPPQPFSL